MEGDGQEEFRNRGSVRDFRDLIVWQKAMDLAEAVYKVTKDFPRDEQFGLTSQIRRAVVSVASNIAEGQGRTSGNEFLHHLSIARGSLCEVQTQIMLAARFSYVNRGDCQTVLAQADEVGRLLRGLSRTIDTGAGANRARRPHVEPADSRSAS